MFIATVMFVLLFGLIGLGLPISIAMGLSILLVMIAGGHNLSTLPLMMLGYTDNFMLMAVPFFIIAGNLLDIFGIRKRVFEFANAAVGYVPGGLTQTTLLAHILLSGISKTSVNNLIGFDDTELDTMTSSGYDGRFSAAIILISKFVSILISPSLPFIVYGLIAKVPIGRLFIAGIVPGIMMGGIAMILNYGLTKKGRIKLPENSQTFQPKRVWESFKSGILVLMAPAVVLTSLILGVLTPTTAGILVIIYALVAGLLYKELTWTTILLIIYKSFYSIVIVMILICFGTALEWVVAVEQIPIILADGLLSVTHNKCVMLLIIDVLIIILSMLVSVIPIQIILLPILLPIIDAFGVDRIHFGVLITNSSLLGMMMSSLSSSLNIVTETSKTTIQETNIPILPFYLSFLFVTIIITCIPEITKWLPDILMPIN